MEAAGIIYSPIYFDEQIVEETGESLYVFNGKYWEDRANRNWSKLTKIFDWIQVESFYLKYEYILMTIFWYYYYMLLKFKLK